MNKKDAMNVLNMSIFTKSILKQAYVKACFKYHPDRNPAGLEIMKAVNIAYAFLKSLPDSEENETANVDGTGIDFGEAMNNALNAIIELGDPELIIEICGNWIWLSGNTKPHKDAIKAAGFYWASKKFQWYFRPAEWKGRGRGTYDMDTIRAKFGSDSIQAKPKTKLYQHQETAAA